MLKRLKRSKINPLSLAVIALLLFIPLYPKFPLSLLIPQFVVPGTYVAIRIEDFLVAGVVFLWFLTQLRQGFPSLKDKVSRLILLYWAVGALSLASAFLITKNVSPHLALLHFVRRIEYMSLFFVALASVKEISNIKSYGWTIFLATLGVFIYGLGQKFLSWPVISTMNVEFSKGRLLWLTKWARVNSTFAGHYDLAAYLVLILAFTAGFVIGLKNRWAKIIAGIVGFLSFYLLTLTASRVSLVAYLIAVTLVLLGLKRYRWLGPVLAFSLVAMLLSSEISQRYAHTFNIDLSPLSEKIRSFQRRGVEEEIEEVEEIVEIPTPIVEEGAVVRRPGPMPEPEKKVATPIMRLAEEKPSTELAVEYSSAIRFKVEWPRALRAFAKNPFLGTGYSSVTLATDNDYLRILAETGIFGLISFGLIFLEIARRVILYLRKPAPDFARAVVVGISGAAIGLFANAIFIDVFEASKVAFIFWILMGILVGTMKITKKAQYVKTD